MRQHEPGQSGLLDPLELIRHFPGEPCAASDRRKWLGLEALRYRDQPPNEAYQPPLTHHSLLLFLHTPKEFELQCEGVNRGVPPRAGSILVVPAGSPVRYRWSSHSDSLHVFLEPGLVARVAADVRSRPACAPPLTAGLPQLRAAMLAVSDELTAGDGGRLAVESLANLLAVHLIRHVLAPRRPQRGRDGTLPRGRLRAVVEYVEGHLDADPSLEQLAAVARLSPYHFARQFKAATGLPPHQYVVTRRVERPSRQLLRAGTDLSLAGGRPDTGFSDQSMFTRHFAPVGVTPGQFRMSARNRLARKSRQETAGHPPYHS